MSGSLNSLRYDSGTYAVDLRQSTAPLLYALDPTYANNCQSCRPADVGWLGRNGVSIERQQALIDTDSELRLLNYRQTRDPQLLYHPANCGAASNYGYPNGGGIAPQVCGQAALAACQAPKYNYPDCGSQLYTDYTRLINPPCSLRETGINRFVPMCLNFQDVNRWLHPGEVGISYRLVVKDNHAPRIPKLLDQSAALPQPTADAPMPPPIWTGQTFIGALNPYYAYPEGTC